MEDNDTDSQTSDPVVAFRKQKNRPGLWTHHMALNTKAIRIVQTMDSMISIEANDIEELKGLLILHMFDLVYKDK